MQQRRSTPCGHALHCLQSRSRRPHAQIVPPGIQSPSREVGPKLSCPGVNSVNSANTSHAQSPDSRPLFLFGVQMRMDVQGSATLV